MWETRMREGVTTLGRMGKAREEMEVVGKTEEGCRRRARGDQEEQKRRQVTCTDDWRQKDGGCVRSKRLQAVVQGFFLAAIEARTEQPQHNHKALWRTAAGC